MNELEKWIQTGIQELTLFLFAATWSYMFKILKISNTHTQNTHTHSVRTNKIIQQSCKMLKSRHKNQFHFYILYIMLYNNSEKFEKEIEKTIPFTITSKRMKHLGINLTNETKDVYTENYKMLLKKLRKQR